MTTFSIGLEQQETLPNNSLYFWRVITITRTLPLHKMYHIKASYPHHWAVKSLYVSPLWYLQMVVLSHTSDSVITEAPWLCLVVLFWLSSSVTTHLHKGPSLCPLPLHPTLLLKSARHVLQPKACFKLVNIDVFMGRQRQLFSLIKAGQSALYLSRGGEVWNVFTRPLRYPGSYNGAQGLCHTWYISN